MNAYQIAIENAALAQADAIERFAELTDSPLPEQRHVTLGREAQCAKLLGRKSPTLPRYPRRRMIERWVRISAGLPVSDVSPITLEQRQARKIHRQQRVESAKSLASLSPQRTLTVAQAATLVQGALSARQIQRAALTGQLPARKQMATTAKNATARYVLAVAALRDYLNHRLGIAA